MRVFYHIARADFLERVRRYSFLITLAAAAYAAWGFIPPNDATWTTLSIKGTRGIYNSAWIGAQVAILTSVFLTMIGFYLIKNSIDRDYHTRVGQIIAATPLSKLKYTVGKMLSNAAVLWAIVGVMVIVAGVMQFVRAENRSVDVFALIAPFLVTMIPVGLLIGAVAVLFECIPALRGGLGNVVYFFLIIAVLSSQIFETADVFGMKAYTESMRETAMAAYPARVAPDDFMNMGFQIHGGERVHLETFVWEGADYSVGMIFGRLFVVFIAFGLAAAASLAFDRFDSARAAGPVQKKQSWLDRLVVRVESLLTPRRDAPLAGATAHLTPLSTAALRPRFLKTVMAELRIMLKGQHAVWYLGSLGLFIAGLFTPAAAGLTVVLPIAWIWPTLIWSQLGCREVRQGTNQYIFSTARPVMRQLPATWLAGALTAMLVGGGVGIHLLATGNIPAVTTWVVGALFVPALALACGTWTNGSRLFEALYLFWWYAGPLNRVPSLDYMGASGELHTAGITMGYAVITCILITLALLGRKRQISI